MCPVVDSFSLDTKNVEVFRSQTEPALLTVVLTSHSPCGASLTEDHFRVWLLMAAPRHRETDFSHFTEQEGEAQ